MKGDLHVHSNASDGMLSVARVLESAAAAGLGFVAVTDHNSVAGPPAAEQASPAPAGLRLILGVELSAQPEDGQEIHILGYGVDPQCDELQEVCRQIVQRKREQVQEIGERLRRDGVEIDLGWLQVEDDGTYFGRPLLAQLLVRSGAVTSVREAFDRYLGSDSAAFVRMREFSPRRCIQAIQGAGGLAVLAHPSIETVDRWIAPLSDLRLDGIEAYRPACTGNEQLYIEKAAEHFRLFVTGGSDWHGRPGEPPLGTFTVEADHVRGFFEALSRRGGPSL